MMASPRLARRLCGVIAKRVPELKLHLVVDPRKARGRRWRLQPLLRALLVGVIAGCKGLGQVERLTDELTDSARRLVGILRRVPDTTMRDLLLRSDPEQLRSALHRLVRRARERGALSLDGLPFGVLSLDGKVVATNTWDAAGRIAQVQHLADGGARALVRTVTSCLISCAARVCVDMHIIPPETNESGVFGDVVRRLAAEYGDLFRVFMYDSAANSRANARIVLGLGRDYVFAVKAEQPRLLDECSRRLGRKRPSTAVHRGSTVNGGRVVTRTVWVVPLHAEHLDYPGLRAGIRVRTETVDKTTGEVGTEDRFYVSSLSPDALTGAQWATMIRRRWAVENECHCTLDKILREDDRPWVRSPEAMVNVMLLRRIALTILALHRVRRAASDGERPSWTEMLHNFYVALITATATTIAGLRLPMELQATG